MLLNSGSDIWWSNPEFIPGRNVFLIILRGVNCVPFCYGGFYFIVYSVYTLAIYGLSSNPNEGMLTFIWILILNTSLK